MLTLSPSWLAMLSVALLANRALATQSVSGQQSTAAGEALEPALQRNNLLVVLADDLSVDCLPIYGLDPSVPANLTPNIDSLAAQGVLFLNAYGYPLCSPARAALLTGDHAHRTGIGNVIESAAVSLPPGTFTLPEALQLRAPQPYATGAFGKWHLEDKNNPAVCPMLAHGFDVFVGSLWAAAPAYCLWNQIACPSSQPVSINATYMPSTVFDEAIGWTSLQQGSWFCLVEPEAPYEIPHTPPMSLQSIVTGEPCNLCGVADRTCWNAQIQAFDTKLGELIASLGPNWWTHTTVVFTADNGTPDTVNTYWPGGGKGQLTEGGVHVPMIIAGKAVDPGRRGSIEDGLVQLTDVYRTLARQGGVGSVPAQIARDSVDLGPLLRSPPAGPVRSYAYAELFKRNATPGGPYEDHVITIRNDRYKLIWDQTQGLPISLSDLAVDPLEANNLLVPQIPDLSTPAGAAYLELLTQIAAQLSS